MLTSMVVARVPCVSDPATCTLVAAAAAACSAGTSCAAVSLPAGVELQAGNARTTTSKAASPAPRKIRNPMTASVKTAQNPRPPRRRQTIRKRSALPFGQEGQATGSGDVRPQFAGGVRGAVMLASDPPRTGRTNAPDLIPMLIRCGCARCGGGTSGNGGIHSGGSRPGTMRDSLNGADLYPCHLDPDGEPLLR